MKKLYLVVAVLVMAAMLVPACTPTAPDCTLPEVFCVGMVTDVGKIDDKSFNQSAWEGVQQSKTDGVADWVQYIETTDAKDYDKNIATFADAGYDAIVTVGFALGEATAAAAIAYPNIYFIGVDQFQAWPYDTDTANDIANLAGLNFPEDQAGFLVGALAAMMTETGKIGGVFGTDAVPPVWRFGEGYRAGALYINPDIEIFIVYHSDVGFDKTFTDPEWGAQTADSMIDNGADVIFGGGGKTGNGAVVEAALRGVYAIGVDTDQYYTLPEAAPKLLSSAMKLITPGVAGLIVAAKDAQGGGAAFPAGNYMGLGGYAPYHDLDSVVPADVKTRMEEINAGLLDGTILTGVSPVKP
ncbi:MAG: membrane protein [Anaerolineaceae bacterium]|nr:MAG: membrane protein [Anaerolineaceae bacterium]